MAGATVAVKGDFWSAFSNPACISPAPATIVALEYLPAIWGIAEIKRGGVSLEGTFPFATMALSMSTLGFQLYRESSVQLTAAHEISDKISVGVSVNAYSLTIQDYGSDQTVGLDLGMVVLLAPGVSYGVAFHNANRPTIGAAGQPLPQSMTMGISVCPLPAALVAVSAEKDTRFPFQLSVGAEYCLEELLTFRLGATHEPSTIAAGIGLRTSLLCMDYAYSMHPDLGGTHCFSVSFVVPWP